MDRQPGEGGGMAHPMRRRGMPRELDNSYREEGCMTSKGRLISIGVMVMLRDTVVW